MGHSQRSEKFWAIVRFILGSLQMFTSSMALVLLVNLGTHPVALSATAVACGFTLTSLWLFRGNRRHGSGDGQ